MNRYSRLGLLAVLLFATLLAPAVIAAGSDYDDYATHSIIGSEWNTGVEIKTIDMFYRPNTEASDGSVFNNAMWGTPVVYKMKGLAYEIAYENTDTAKSVVAVELGMMFFDPWNDYIATQHLFQGSVLGPGKDVTRKENLEFPNCDRFYSTFTWINAVRFDDGTTFEAQPQQVIDQINASMGTSLSADFAEIGYSNDVNTHTRDFSYAREYVN
ncbi:MAG: hypothetical protein ABI743_10060 [bacterium]